MISEMVNSVDSGVVLNQWISTKIGELLSLEYGKGLKDYQSDLFPVPVYGTNGIIGTTNSAIYDQPSLVIGRKGAYRGVHITPPKFFVIDTAFYTKNRTDNTDVKFLYYWFQCVDVNSMDSGSAIPSTSRDEVYELAIDLPPLAEQRAIAGVLSSLDDKIDLLHRQNKTLESLAETLFRQWFIEEAEDDWEEVTLGDLVVHLKNGVVPSNQPTELFHHFSLPAFDSGRSPTLELGAQILSNKYCVEDGTILVSKLNPRFPRIWPIQNSPSNAVCSTEFQVLKPKKSTNFSYVYFLLTSEQAREELAMSASGTSGSHQRVRPEDILNISCKFPSEIRLVEFSQIVDVFMSKLADNTIQTRTLENLRDTLLPKLMSGEVRAT